MEGAGLLDPHQLAVGHSVGSISAGCGPLCCRVGAGGSGLKAGVTRVNVTPAVPASGDAMQGKEVLPAYGGGGGGSHGHRRGGTGRRRRRVMVCMEALNLKMTA